MSTWLYILNEYCNVLQVMIGLKCPYFKSINLVNSPRRHHNTSLTVRHRRHEFLTKASVYTWYADLCSIFSRAVPGTAKPLNGHGRLKRGQRASAKYLTLLTELPFSVSSSSSSSGLPRDVINMQAARRPKTTTSRKQEEDELCVRIHRSPSSSGSTIVVVNTVN